MFPLNLLRAIKYRLSHIDEDSWRYKAVGNMFKFPIQDSKTCTFYWFKLPKALLALGIMGAVLLFLAMAMT